MRKIESFGKFPIIALTSSALNFRQGCKVGHFAR